ncbi:hypothetical protein MTBPR1_10082 [Candidatus Terasakiella magnetica]|uniref:Uncharacterized protein n=1 Tax=Candidatus Terasakiella magnetica TaxID=1867952 RepID=A0A1C3RC41_9PROT|nr:hypothetical protein MTBPR1_10082 [Candidatus Terasakiella magnetica]
MVKVGGFSVIQRNALTFKFTHNPLKLNKKPHEINRRVFNGGRLGIRTPGTSRYNGFQDRRFRPLSQPSTVCVGRLLA